MQGSEPTSTSAAAAAATASVAPVPSQRTAPEQRSAAEQVRQLDFPALAFVTTQRFQQLLPSALCIGNAHLFCGPSYY